MPKKTTELIDYMLENSKIREYCEINQKLSLAFNEVILAYAKLLNGHSALIEKFIMAFTGHLKKSEVKGVSGTQVSKIIHRHKVVESQVIKIHW